MRLVYLVYLLLYLVFQLSLVVWEYLKAKLALTLVITLSIVMLLGVVFSLKPQTTSNNLEITIRSTQKLEKLKQNLNQVIPQNDINLTIKKPT